TVFNARVAKEPRIIKDGFMKFEFVMTSKGEGDAEVWWTVVPHERDFDTAQYLQKGDVLSVTGFPTVNVWGDTEKQDHVLKFPRLRYPIELLMTLKKRKETANADLKTKIKKKINLDDAE